ncbi:hypothetical protein B0A48_16392 [Cryoendolithus antarcticus]|uniref:AB hydrolase-1 domain-containing protein n=1 Tax=Cryoendolithus antarcticus TaxID=1507870 RepID=A0A1V8SDT6_9PEZI|nr:hypothetical protein B0A48_16392 [Cryoendolithus antarcticus]
MASKPIILLILGGMTHNTCYDPLKAELHKSGYETVVASLPSADPADPLDQSLTAANDARSIYAKSVKPLLDAGKDVVIYAYSYGGTVFGNDGPSFVKSERNARGEKGGIVGILYMSIATVPAGMGQLEFMGGTWPPFIVIDQPKKGFLTFDHIIAALFNDAAPADAEELAKTVVGHSSRTFDTGVLPPLWAERALDGKRVWLLAQLDGTFPPEAARTIIAASGVEWEVIERDVGHCGFVTQPGVVAKVIVEAATKWA